MEVKVCSKQHNGCASFGKNFFDGFAVRWRGKETMQAEIGSDSLEGGRLVKGGQTFVMVPN